MEDRRRKKTSVSGRKRITKIERKKEKKESGIRQKCVTVYGLSGVEWFVGMME